MDLSHIQQKFKEGILETRERNPRRTTFHIKSTELLPLATHLFREAGFRFIIASALHTRKGFEIYYHFSYDPSGLILNLHVLLDARQPEIESLTPLFEAANWIEREMHELFGINFLHHPNQEQLLSEGNWAEGVYPYRKDFHHSDAPEP